MYPRVAITLIDYSLNWFICQYDQYSNHTLVEQINYVELKEIVELDDIHTKLKGNSHRYLSEFFGVATQSIIGRLTPLLTVADPGLTVGGGQVYRAR